MPLCACSLHYSIYKIAHNLRHLGHLQTCITDCSTRDFILPEYTALLWAKYCLDLSDNSRECVKEGVGCHWTEFCQGRRGTTVSPTQLLLKRPLHPLPFNYLTDFEPSHQREKSLRVQWQLGSVGGCGRGGGANEWVDVGRAGVLMDHEDTHTLHRQDLHSKHTDTTSKFWCYVATSKR